MNRILFCGWKWIFIAVLLPKPHTVTSTFENLARWFVPEKDARMSLTEYVESRGYRLDQHRVVTEDGYILALFRIIDVNHPGPRENLKPVILNHGVFCEPGTALVNSPFLLSNTSRYGDNLGFSMVLTQRYDVWLPESRGQSHSLGHVNMSWLQKDYWKFQWDTMAVYDLPAIIQYVQRATGRKHIAYVGFSQANIIMFTLMSIRPEYADIVQPVIALSPDGYMSNMKGLLHLLLKIPYEKLFQLIGYFMPSFLFLEPCQIPLLSPLCYLLMTPVVGYSHRQNISRYPVYFHHFQPKESLYHMAYYGQNFKNDALNRFDYGSIGNLRHYGRLRPPAIRLERIPKHAKIAFFQGGNDFFFRPPDRQKLLAKFQQAGIKLILDFMISDPNWVHLDFVFGTDAGRLYIDRMIDVLDQYSI